MAKSLLSALDDIPMRFLEVEALTRGLEDWRISWTLLQSGTRRLHQNRLEFGRLATPCLSSGRCDDVEQGCFILTRIAPSSPNTVDSQLTLAPKKN